MRNTFQLLFGTIILGGALLILNGRHDIIIDQFNQFYEAVAILVN